MITAFINIRILDIIDIILVALLFYQAYRRIKTSIAINIFIGIFSIYLFWLLVKALKMHLLTTILGQFMGVGVIALIIVFQQEIRRFFLHIGTQYFSRKSRLLFDFMSKKEAYAKSQAYHQAIIDACFDMGESKTGALIILSNKLDLSHFAETGDFIHADVNTNLLKTIFFKNSPLHDGAMFITKGKILASRCTLPVNYDLKLPSHYGMRHLSAVSMNVETDTLAIVVSEETGRISYAWEGEIHYIKSRQEFEEVLKLDY